MKTIIIREPGGPDVLTLADVPMPVPRASEVLIHHPEQADRPSLLLKLLENPGMIAAKGTDADHGDVDERVGSQSTNPGAGCRRALILLSTPKSYTENCSQETGWPVPRRDLAGATRVACGVGAALV